jgi:hypothetical protein
MNTTQILKDVRIGAVIAFVAGIAACSSGVTEPRSAATVDSSVCDGIPPDEQVRGLLAEVQVVDDVVPVKEALNPKSTYRLKGAEIYVRSRRATTAQWLSRVVQCHAYRHATASDPLGDEATCPLAVKGASASVEETSTGFVVVVRSSRNEIAEEILARSQSLHVGSWDSALPGHNP